MSEAVCLISILALSGHRGRAALNQLIKEAIYLRTFRSSTCRPMTCIG